MVLQGRRAVPGEGGGGRGEGRRASPHAWPVGGEAGGKAGRVRSEGSVAPEPLVPLVDGSRRAFALTLLKGHV